MNMPRFTAEASLYHTNNHYWSAGGSFLSDGNTTVTPQGCGIFEKLRCGFFVGLGVAGCTALCLDGGPPACAACWAAIFPADLYINCRDCIPSWMRALIDIFEGGGGDGAGGGGQINDCTTTGCGPGQVCCDCVSPGRCMSPEACRNNPACRL
jgi:hypothetical protein